MIYNAKNCNVEIDDTDMDYITFGYGKKKLIIIPGLGDALKTVRGTAFTFSWMYKIFAKEYKVYVFSRKNKLEEGYSINDMAIDLAIVMEKLNISKAYVMGVSQGGMIAQCLAINRPDLVERLVLAVTLCRHNDTSKSGITNWIQLAKANDFKNIFIDTAEKTYTERRLKSYRPFYSILSKLSKPASLDRFIIQARACLNHNVYEDIIKIQCPTFVIGGDADKIVGENSAKEMSEHISGSKLKIYKGLGHSTYEEAKDFNLQVFNFFTCNLEQLEE